MAILISYVFCSEPENGGKHKYLCTHNNANLTILHNNTEHEQTQLLSMAQPNTPTITGSSSWVAPALGFSTPLRVKAELPPTTPFKFRCTRRRIEATLEMDQDRDDERDFERLKEKSPYLATRKGSPHRVYERIAKVPTLKERCREVFHLTLLKNDGPYRSREDFEKSFKAAVGEGILPEEVVEYLLAAREFSFHPMPKPYDPRQWQPNLQRYDFDFHLREDPQACTFCLRGSRDPSHKLMRCLLLHDERISEDLNTGDFDGVCRSFLRVWVCGALCYAAVKDGHAFQLIEGSLSVSQADIIVLLAYANARNVRIQKVEKGSWFLFNFVGQILPTTHLTGGTPYQQLFLTDDDVPHTTLLEDLIHDETFLARQKEWNQAWESDKSLLELRRDYVASIGKHDWKEMAVEALEILNAEDSDTTLGSSAGDYELSEDLPELASALQNQFLCNANEAVEYMNMDGACYKDNAETDSSYEDCVAVRIGSDSDSEPPSECDEEDKDWTPRKKGRK
jgi:hypothetical protein